MTDDGKSERNRVYRQVRTAIKQGILSRPDRCEKCGRDPGRGKDGRSLVQAHHHDYAKPLEVEWICALCHREVTEHPLNIRPSQPGEENPFSKLTDDAVMEIRAMRAKGMLYREIGERFGIDRTTVSNAVRGKSWTHIVDSEDK